MHRFYLMIRAADDAVTERVALDAANGDHALHLAEIYARDGDVELWDGERMLAKREANMPQLWTVQSAPAGNTSGAVRTDGVWKAGEGIAVRQG
ncbi:MAG: hypothetical protein HEQ22_04345 [Sphingopyxis sp.]|uniref:hypothetical protein n=1 Tax=Sphingopyxis sp. TaxID=1908224 RepID=UPI003D8120A3